MDGQGHLWFRPQVAAVKQRQTVARRAGEHAVRERLGQATQLVLAEHTRVRASQAVLQTATLGLGVAASEMAVGAELTHNACLGAVPGWRTQGQRDFLERAIVVDDEDE